MENRTYENANLKYKYTGKERDNENNYDYFGARYYDSRIGRWGGVEPLLERYFSYSPFIYVFDNPILMVDVDGRGLGDGLKYWWTTKEDIKNTINEIEKNTEEFINNTESGNFSGAMENYAKAPIIALGLIPSSPMTDFIMPIGMVEQTPKLLKLSQGLKDKASEIANFIGKSRVTMPEGTLDLIGKSHGLIETPHFKPLIFQTSEGKFFPKTLSKLTREATHDDLKNAVDFINKVITIEFMNKTKF